MAAGRDIKFKVKLLDQSVQELELDASTLCSDVKLVLEALTNIPATRQRLIYRGRVLRDDSSLQELGIEDGHTIHLIEREAPAAGAGGPGRTAGAQAAPDVNSMLQGVFSALGGLGQPPAAAGAAAGAAGQQPAGPEPVHLLQSIATFLQQLQSGAGAAGGDTAMPVTSLALGGTTGTQQLQNALTAALRNILAGQALTAGQQAQLAAAASTAAAATGAAAGTGTYPYMQLVLVALGLLLNRAQAYLSGPLAAGLAQGAQQLAALAQQQGLNTAEASQGLTRISGQLQSAAALLVELARAASASSVELQGTNPLLTANTAAVLQQGQGAGGRLTPAFPTLYPQLPPGMGGDRNAAGRPISLALPDFGNPADVAQFAGRLANTVLTGLGTGIAASGSNAAAAGGQAGAAPAAAAGGGAAGGTGSSAAEAAPSNAQVAQMVAAALTSSLAPVIERVSADVAGAVRTGRDSISSGQFQNASTTAANVAAQTVSGTVGRVLTSVSETLNRNLSGIEQRLQEVEREQGRQVNAIDIAAAVQHVLLPHMQPLGDVLGAAARAAASSAAAANQAAATAATAAQEAATAAAAAGQAAAAAAGDPAPAAGAAAPSSPPPAAAAERAGASSSTSSGSQPRGLGLGTGLKGSALPAKRKAQGPAGTDAAAGAAGTSTAPAAGAAAPASGSSGAAARSAATAPGSAGRGAPPPDLGALMQMMMGGAGGQQQQQQTAAGGGMGTGAAGGGPGGGGDLSGLMQMMGGLLGGGAPGGGGSGAAGGTGGMGGLLQMAGQIASDPAMQPLLSGMANAVLGGGGAGGGQGLGGLLGGLLGPGGLGGPGMGGPGGSGARSATVVASMDDLEQELPADLAAEWRRVLQGDERAQAGGVAQGRGPLSEVYQAGAPTAGRRGLIPGLPV